MILVCGDSILDEIREYGSDKISAEAPIPVLIPKNKFFFLGGAANVANNIKKLSGQVFFLSLIGKDKEGLKIKRLLKHSKIKHKLLEDNSYKTSHKNRGHLDKKLIFRVDSEEPKKIKLLHKKIILKFIKKNIKNFSSIIISDYNKGFFDKDLIKKISLIFKNENKLIITNPKNRNISYYNYSNIIVPNEKEFNNFFTKKISLKKKINDFFNKIVGLKHLIITRGYKSVLIASFEKKIRIKYLKVDRVRSTDVTGASDTFLATLSVYLEKKFNILQSSRKAIKASKKVVTKKYTSFVKKHEIE